MIGERTATPATIGCVGFGVALLRCGHHLGVDDLPAHGEETSRPQRRLIGVEQHLDRRLPVELRLGERFPEGPDGVGVGYRVGEPQGGKAHESA